MELGSFLKQRDIIFTLCAAALSSQIVSIADLLATTCFVPFYGDYNSDEEHSQKNIEKFFVKVNGSVIDMSKIILALIRLLFISIILFCIFKFTH